MSGFLPAAVCQEAIYLPTRGDQRRSRQILAGVREGEFSIAVGRIADGSLGNVIRFLAGCNLIFLLIGWDERKRLHALGSPSLESVALLVDCLGGKSSSVTTCCVPSTAAGRLSQPSTDVVFRSPWVESAVNQVVDGLHRRDLSFILGWQVPSQTVIRLDHTIGADHEKVAYYLGWFRKRLGIPVPVSEMNDVVVDSLAVGVEGS